MLLVWYGSGGVNPVFAQGKTRAFVLFRDKRVFIEHRGPATVQDTDTRAFSVFRDKRAMIRYRNKRSGNN